MQYENECCSKIKHRIFKTNNPAVSSHNLKGLVRSLAIVSSQTKVTPLLAWPCFNEKT
jgi:hypothetical protein